ncbi:MAG: helix-turn-helix domain-containing protein [Opitutae bacterium]
MQTIGERLEEARKRKGISVREAAETTKIRGDYLQKFEANSFDLDLPPLYIRGFLRAYARHLELDPERIVNDFNTVLASEGKPGRRETREVYGRMELGEAARSTPETNDGTPAGRSAQDQALLLKFGLLGGGALIAIIVILMLVKVLFTSTPVKSPTASPQQASAPAMRPVDSKENSLTLIARGPVRVKVTRMSDNQVLFPGLVPMAAGETKLIRYSSKLKVTVDDPSKLSIETNGQRQEVPIREYGYFFIEP